MIQAAKVERMEERTRGTRAAARKEEKGKRRVAKENPDHVGRAARQDTLQFDVEQWETHILYAVDGDDCENAEESTENEEDVQAWCWLEESENEQWQEVISKQNERKNPHIRNFRDGTVIKLDVSNGVYTMDMWICLDETGPVFNWQGQLVVKPLSTSL